MLYVNDIQVVPTIFPDKTSQVWNLPEYLLGQTVFVIRWEFSNEAEIIQLAQLAMLLKEHSLDVNLELKYLPYGRQDKEIGNNRTFALRAFAKIINSMCFDRVVIMDPHSDVATELIHDSVATFCTKQLLFAMNFTKTDLICYPDHGAVTKYTKIKELPYVNFPYIFGVKVRDQQSGKILSYELRSEQYMAPFGKTVMIVDDICDGGATFIILAKQLYEKGAKEVHLFVTHGIFSKGLRPLFDAGIKRIFTQDGEASGDQAITYRRL